MAMKANLKHSTGYVWGVLRILLGTVFFWAFIDKFFGLGFSTCRDQATNAVNFMCEKAVVGGGSPTEGFLQFGTSGPFAPFYQSLAGNWFIDVIFMVGLLGIGVALLLGIGMRIATISGVAMLMMMYTAALPLENNPVVDDHVIYSVALAGLLFANDHQKLGFGKRWQNTKLVKKVPLLR